jgi:beta-lactamase regulating signal transducer with metallopeptidase domain
VSAAIVDHLWQSSLFAAAGWLLARSLRDNGAHLRYWVWFAASIKFLVPFSLLVSLGTILAPPLTTRLPVVPVGEAREFVTSLWMPATSTLTGGLEFATVKMCFAVIWAIGCAGLLARCCIQCARIHRIVRAAVPTGSLGSLPMTSRLIGEPGVVGILRPVLLLPEGMIDRLTSAQFEAVLAHETCHVRRRDNLLAAIHVLVEAAFWFHPLVWWIGARLVDERERACDESVLRAGHAPRTYAEGILRVCQSCVRANPDFVAGVSGADLMTRLEEIMTNDVSTRLNRGKRWMLSLAATAALGLPVFIGLTASPEARAEAAKPMTATKVEMLAGKRVRLNYDRVDVRALLQGIAKAAGVNMLVSDKVVGDITVHLDEMPWEQALNIVLQSQRLSKRESNGIIFVEPAA